MARFVLSLVFFGFLTAFGASVHAQGFPYSAPQAPEFDDRGNVVGRQESPAVRSRSKRVPNPPTNVDRQTNYRSVQPYNYQEAPQAPTFQPNPNAPIAASPPAMQAPPPKRKPAARQSGTAAAQPQQPQNPQQRMIPDCSHFPVLLAQAKSDAEMQGIAREYLTCLIHSGWTMEQARSHVISAYETSRLAR